MALELACFQVSTISSSSTPNKLNPNHPFPHKERLRLRPKRSISSFLTTSSTSSFKHYQSNGRANRFICQAKNAVDGVEAVDDKSWDTAVMANEAPVIVEFWAPWCGPCRMIAPVIDELAKEYAGKIACYKVNTDDCPNIASKYGIRSIPTVLFFKNGEKKESVIGAVPKTTLSATLEKYL